VVRKLIQKVGEETMKTYKVLDLFAGGGGFSTGFLSTASYQGYSFEVTRALEIDPAACETLEKHLGKEKVIQGDITDKKTKEKVLNDCRGVDVIIGGPPCQTFSLAGPARSGAKAMRDALKNDPRNLLYNHFFDLVREIKPPFVVFENVEGIVSKKVDSDSDDLTKKQQQVIELICDDLESLGYNTNVEGELTSRYQVLNAADYGVPQNRKRIIIIANRLGITENPVPPKTHGVEQSLQPYKTVRDAIGDLPFRLPVININNMNQLKNMDVIIRNFEKSLRIFKEHIEQLVEQLGETDNSLQEGLTTLCNYLDIQYQNYKDRKNYKYVALTNFLEGYNQIVSDLEVLQNDSNLPTETLHISRKHNFRDIIIFILTKQGSNSSRYMNHSSGDYDVFLDELYPYAKNKHKDTYVKHSWTKPSNTILAHMEKDGLKFIHPDQPRTFTPYEAALLQSFPQDYSFLGLRNAQYRQIGNAVPPLMAKAIAEVVLKAMVEKENHIENIKRERVTN